MTLGDIDVWTENWAEQTGRQLVPRRPPPPPELNGFKGIAEEQQVG